MKKFILEVFSYGELDEVIEGLNNINEYLRPMMDNPPIEDTSDDFEDIYGKELEEEEYD